MTAKEGETRSKKSESETKGVGMLLSVTVLAYTH